MTRLSYFVRAGEALLPWVDWWISELQSLCDDLVDAARPAGRSIAEIRRAGTGIEVDWRGDEKASRGRVRRAIVLCPAEDVLVKRLDLPLAARHRLRDIVTLLLEKEMPLRSQLVYFDYEVVSRDVDTGTMEVELAVVRRASVATWIAALRDRGIKPVALRCDFYGTGPGRFNFLPGIGSVRHAAVHRWDRPLAIGAGMLAAVIAALTVWQWQSERSYVGDQLRELQSQAKRAEEANNELVAQSAMMAAIEAELRQPTAGKLIDELSRLVPPDSWVQELHLTEGELRLTGISTDGASLAAAIGKSPVFERVILGSSAPVGAAPGQDRVELTLRVQDGGA